MHQIYKNTLLFSGERNKGIWNAGIYDSDKKAVETANLARHGKNIIELTDKSISSFPFFAKRSGSAVFGGFAFNHFGHFLIESLNRYYFYKTTDEPVIFISETKEPTSWQKEIFDMLKITKRVIFTTGKHRVRHLTVPKAGYIIPNFYLQENFDSLAVCSETDSEFEGRKIWLSRSKLKTRFVKGEELLEQELEKNGWLIVATELLSVKKQAVLFNSASRIAGFSGSSFHGVILSAGTKAAIDIFSLYPGMLKNYINIADAKKLNQKIHNINLLPPNSANTANTVWQMTQEHMNRILDVLKS